MPEQGTDRWVKDTLLQHTQVHAKILNKLEQGEDRMERIEASLGTVVEATAEFQPLKVDVAQLKKAEELRKKEAELNLRNQIESLEAQKNKWAERAWELFKMSLPWIALAVIWITTQMSKGG